MGSALKAKDLEGHQSYLASETPKRKGASQSKTLEGDLGVKKFADLQSSEKDDLLKALALRFNMIAPD